MIDGSHKPKTIWQRAKFTVTLLLILLCFAGLMWGIVVLADTSNKQIRAERAAQAVKDDHIKQCRLQLGIDYQEVTSSYRRSMMACAASVIDREIAKGATGTVAADRAWKACMPDMVSCDAGLR